MNPILRSFLWLGAGLTLLATLAALALLWWLVGAAHGHIDIHFNGEPLVWPGWGGWQGWFQWPDRHGALGITGAIVAALALLLAVPALLLLALLFGALFSAFGVAGVLLALAVAAALALSPLWLVLFGLWLLLRRQRTPHATISP